MSQRDSDAVWLQKEMICESIDQVVQLLKSAVPKVNCPSCDGSGDDTDPHDRPIRCGWCRGVGTMPAWAFEEFKAQ